MSIWHTKRSVQNQPLLAENALDFDRYGSLGLIAIRASPCLANSRPPPLSFFEGILYVKISKPKTAAASAFILAIAFALLAWREARIWLWNSGCYSAWIGLPQYASEIEKVGRAATIAFSIMLFASLIACLLLAVVMWVLRDSLAVAKEPL
jgi:hypothetical protein